MNVSNIFNSNLLNAKKIIVAGASSGIGKYFAIEASKLGAEVILIARNKIKLQAVKEELSITKGQKHTIITYDLSSFKKSKNVFKKIKR